MNKFILLIALNSALLAPTLGAAELPLHCTLAPSDTTLPPNDVQAQAAVCAHAAVLHGLELNMLALQQQAARQTVARHNDPLVAQLLALHAAKEQCLQAVQGLLPRFESPSLRLGGPEQVLGMCPDAPATQR